MANYTLYGQFEDCIETAEAAEGEEEPETWANSCEVLETSDDRPKTDFDELTGSKVTTTLSAFLEWASTKATTPIVLDCLPRSSKPVKTAI